MNVTVELVIWQLNLCLKIYTEQTIIVANTSSICMQVSGDVSYLRVIAAVLAHIHGDVWRCMQKKKKKRTNLIKLKQQTQQKY